MFIKKKIAKFLRFHRTKLVNKTLPSDDSKTSS